MSTGNQAGGADMISFRQAQKHLEERLGARVEEVAAWVLTGMLPAYDETRDGALVEANGALLEGLYLMEPLEDPRRTLFKALAGAQLDPAKVDDFNPQEAAQHLAAKHAKRLSESAEVDDANPSGRFLPGLAAVERIADLTGEAEATDVLVEWLDREALDREALDYFPLAYVEPEWKPGPEELGWIVIGHDELDRVCAETCGIGLARRMDDAARAAKERGAGIGEQRAEALRVMAAAAREVHGQDVEFPGPKWVMARTAARLLPDLFTDKRGDPLKSNPGDTFSEAAKAAGLTFLQGYVDPEKAEQFWARTRHR